MPEFMGVLGEGLIEAPQAVAEDRFQRIDARFTKVDQRLAQYRPHGSDHQVLTLEPRQEFVVSLL